MVITVAKFSIAIAFVMHKLVWCEPYCMYRRY